MKYILSLTFIFSLLSTTLLVSEDRLREVSDLTPAEMTNIRRLVGLNETILYGHFFTIKDTNFKNCNIEMEMSGKAGMKLKIQTLAPLQESIETYFEQGSAAVSFPGDMLKEEDSDMYQYLVTVKPTEGGSHFYLLKYLFTEGKVGVTKIIFKKWLSNGQVSTLQSSITCEQ